MTPEQCAALERHGYDPALLPRGVTGPPGEVTDGWMHNDTEIVRVKLRNHVCELDGIKIDGHEGVEDDPGSTSCLHCDFEGQHP